MNIANKTKLGYVGKRPGDKRDSDAWFTPAKYLEAVRGVFGGWIGLDPFSSVAANRTVKAEKFFTEKDNAHSKEWRSESVFMNPPYSRACLPACEKFISEFTLGSFPVGIVLVNNATETIFFQLLMRHALAVCFTDHRIAFWNSDGKQVSGNTRGQAFFYFSKNCKPTTFQDTFGQFGKVVLCA